MFSTSSPVCASIHLLSCEAEFGLARPVISFASLVSS